MSNNLCNKSSKSLSIFITSILLFSCTSTKYQETACLADLERDIENAQGKIKARKNITRFIQEARQLTRKSTNKSTLPSKPRITKAYLHNSGSGVQADIETAIKPDGTCTIQFQGEINKKNVDIFIAQGLKTLSYPCQDTLIKLNSRGGNISQAIRMGIFIRENGWYTLPWLGVKKINTSGGCISACALTYLGGLKRYKGRAGSLKSFYDSGEVIFHQPSHEAGGVKVCIKDPSDWSILLSYEYFKYVIPDNPLLVTSLLIYKQSCYKTDCYITPRENVYSVIYNAEYIRSIFEKYRIPPIHAYRQ